MAGNSIRINSDQVSQIASSIESLNKKLRETLEGSKSAVNSLANVWEGEAAQSTINAFNEFSAKYFQQYEDILTQYVTFLRQQVEVGYENTEMVNIGLADAFR